MAEEKGTHCNAVVGSDRLEDFFKLLKKAYGVEFDFDWVNEECNL